MRLILGSNISQPSIRDIILIGSYKNDSIMNRKLMKVIGRNQYCKYTNRIKYGGKFGDRLINFGKSFYNKILKPGYDHVVKPVYNATKN